MQAGPTLVVLKLGRTAWARPPECRSDWFGERCGCGGLLKASWRLERVAEFENHCSDVSFSKGCLVSS